MTHQYFDVYECVAMPSLRFFEKIEPVWTRPTMEIFVYKHLFLIPDKVRPEIESSPRSRQVLNHNDESGITRV